MTGYAQRRYGYWVTVGNGVRCVDWTMPAIPDQILDCSVFLYPTEKAARAGNVRGGGSGFLVSVPLDERKPADAKAHYAVTNWHCANKSPWLRIHKLDGTLDVFQPPCWLQHPDKDDVAACAVKLSNHRFHAVELQSAVKSDPEPDMPEPGGDVFFVGRYVTQSGVEKNTPMARFGNIAMLPQEPITNSYGVEQDSFLVEARSRSGFSGSPVFTYRMFTPTMGVGGIGLVAGIRLLGIVWGHLPEWEQVLEEDKETPVQPKRWVGQNSNIACVVPAWKITELLDRKEFRTMRDEQKAELSNTAAVVDTATDADDDEFENFEDLARKLVQTPKPKDGS
jgi:hypothetical protein